MRRFLLRCLLAAALINLGWDALDAADRFTAGHARSLHRGAEAPDYPDWGFAQVTVVNETGGEILLESLVVGDRGGPIEEPEPRHRTLFPPPNAFAARDYLSLLDRVLEVGSVSFRRAPGAPVEEVALTFDRRRPAHCRVEIRVSDGGASATPCAPWDPKNAGVYKRFGFWIY